MAKLSASERAKLPDSAFAYVDSRGHRRLPIHDEAHVRNALARFDRVAFEDEHARERARTRLLRAAKRYGIVPVGFIDGQLRTERQLGAGARVAALPRGFVTFLFTDIEDSTGLLQRLGDRYAELLASVRSVVRAAVMEAGGREVDARADEFFAVFVRAPDALRAAVEFQRAMLTRSWPDDAECRVRVGIHSGRASLTPSGYIGLAVHAAARVCFVAHGGQIVASRAAKLAVDAAMPPGVRLRDLGAHPLAGLPRPEQLFQVEADGLRSDFPALRPSVQ